MTPTMAKNKPVVHLHSYGIFTTWDSESKKLPKIKEFTLDIPAEIDIEFGFTVNIKKAKGEKIRYCIYQQRCDPYREHMQNHLSYRRQS